MVGKVTAKKSTVQHRRSDVRKSSARGRGGVRARKSVPKKKNATASTATSKVSKPKSRTQVLKKKVALKKIQKSSSTKKRAYVKKRVSKKDAPKEGAPKRGRPRKDAKSVSVRKKAQPASPKTPASLKKKIQAVSPKTPASLRKRIASLSIKTPGSSKSKTEEKRKSKTPSVSPNTPAPLETKAPLVSPKPPVSLKKRTLEWISKKGTSDGAEELQLLTERKVRATELRKMLTRERLESLNDEALDDVRKLVSERLYELRDEVRYLEKRQIEIPTLEEKARVAEANLKEIQKRMMCMCGLRRPTICQVPCGHVICAPCQGGAVRCVKCGQKVSSLITYRRE